MQPLPKKMVPLTADMVTVSDHAKGKITSAGKFFRDEDCRTRVEHGDIVTISDPLKGESYVLKVPEKIAIPAQPEMPPVPALSVPSIPKPPVPAPAIPELQPPAMQEMADLGEKVIDGIKVQGKQYAMPAPPQPPRLPGMPPLPKVPKMAVPAPPQPAIAEIWTSPELNLPIHSSVVDPKTGARCVTEMKNIKQGAQLDPAMFQVPPDFKIASALKPPPVPNG